MWDFQGFPIDGSLSFIWIGFSFEKFDFENKKLVGCVKSFFLIFFNAMHNYKLSKSFFFFFFNFLYSRIVYDLTSMINTR